LQRFVWAWWVPLIQLAVFNYRRKRRRQKGRVFPFQQSLFSLKSKRREFSNWNSLKNLLHTLHNISDDRHDLSENMWRSPREAENIEREWKSKRVRVEYGSVGDVWKQTVFTFFRQHYSVNSREGRSCLKRVKKEKSREELLRRKK
jgi:hypothetical protein